MKPHRRFSTGRRRRVRIVAALAAAVSLVVSPILADPATSNGESFTETLTLRPLVDGRVHAFFEFLIKSTATPASSDDTGGWDGAKSTPSDHFRLLPRSLIQIARATGVEDLSLSLHRGTWDYERWGSPLFWDERSASVQGDDAVGAGAEIWATISAPATTKSKKRTSTTNMGMEGMAQYISQTAAADLSPVPIIDSVMARWRTLTASLAGIFCASLDAADDKVAVRPLRDGEIYSADWTTSSGAATERLYAALPSENICTENLAPLLKLLPCKSSAGLAQLLSPHAVLSSGFHGLYVRVFKKGSGWEVKLNFQAVFSPMIDHERRAILRRDWSMMTLFGREVTRSCPLADTSTVTVMRPPTLKSGIQDNIVLSPQPMMWEQLLLSDADFSAEMDAQKDAADDIEDSVEAKKHRSKTRFATIFQRQQSVAYNAKELWRYPEAHLNVGLSWPDEQAFRFPTLGSLPAPPSLTASRSLISSGQEAGQVVLRISNKDILHERRVLYTESLPWLLKPYMHTIRIDVRTDQASLKGHTPSEDESRRVYFRDELEPPFLLSLAHQPPVPRERSFLLEAELRIPPSSTLILTYDVAKAYLRYTEHLPDAHRGFDLPSAVITPLLDSSSRQGLAVLQQARIYTQPALLEVAVPDFSMPYNVIIMTSTIIALFFGSVFNNLTRKYSDIFVK
ncbi:Gpi16 subunit, GPI transamidase component [Tilletiaria anomala UBC 951]|uniref:Gpi16 subunit, GPI transamidase component n=1 Tax=Tilletiaria anomala (strain ATCC 24038 / CBS 436.72 / UBC 951) TaxID=1037660 RepID=A0A066VYA8_TILAU|nr:Gpi16 subunit, GPI transamidase component [Tilletiaria anomala UBC 951]KDN46451.1 Gpi16 subunit, GPI transamidase component [Tilletiaria anomala UBC 951]